MKSKTAQLILQSAYCALGIVAILSSVGFFDYRYDQNWYVYFTHLSNYFCVGVMFAELMQTAKKSEDGYVSACPCAKFIGVCAIMLTCIAFNTMLADGREAAANFTVSSVLMHVVLPILFFIDWVLFYEHGAVKAIWPLFSTIPLLGYVAMIYIRAAIVNYNANCYTLYPYFFLDLNEKGVHGVITWCIILAIAYLLFVYALYGLDKWLQKRKQKQICHS